MMFRKTISAYGLWPRTLAEQNSKFYLGVEKCNINVLNVIYICKLNISKYTLLYTTHKLNINNNYLL